jgi:methyl-accepting chemotaxis protein
VDRVTQQNAASAEESSSAASELSGQAEELGAFQIERHGAAARALPAPARPTTPQRAAAAPGAAPRALPARAAAEAAFPMDDQSMARDF